MSVLAVILAAAALAMQVVVPGPAGPAGSAGLSCWDLNGNGVKDVAAEDLDGDGTVDVADCDAASAPVVAAANGRNYLNTTASRTFADIPGVAVDVTVYRTSLFVITFSAESYMNASGDYILIRAFVDSTAAQPGSPGLLGWVSGTDATTISCTFYLEDVVPGTHRVHVQWRSWMGTAEANIDHWSLVVLAVPQ